MLFGIINWIFVILNAFFVGFLLDLGRLTGIFGFRNPTKSENFQVLQFSRDPKIPWKRNKRIPRNYEEWQGFLYPATP